MRWKFLNNPLSNAEIKYLDRICLDITRLVKYNNSSTKWPCSSKEFSYYCGDYIDQLLQCVFVELDISDSKLISKIGHPNILSQYLHAFMRTNAMEKISQPRKIFSKIIRLIDVMENNSPSRHHRYLKNVQIKENLNPFPEKEAKKLVLLLGTYNELVNPIYRGFGFEIHGYYPEKNNLVERTFYFSKLKELGFDEIIFQTFGEKNKEFRTDIWGHTIVSDCFENCYTTISDSVEFESKIQKAISQQIEKISKKSKKELIVHTFESYCYSFFPFWDSKLEKIKNEGLKEIYEKKEVILEDKITNFNEDRFYGGMKKKLLTIFNKES